MRIWLLKSFIYNGVTSREEKCGSKVSKESGMSQGSIKVITRKKKKSA